MASVFGIMQSLDVKVATTTLVGTILFLIVWEFFLKQLETTVGETSYKEMVSKLYKELMLMGFVSFGVFIVRQTQIEESSPWFVAFDFAQTVTFFMAVFLFLQAGALMALSVHIHQVYDRADVVSLETVLSEYAEASPWDRLRFHWTWLPCSELRHTMEFRVISLLFKQTYYVPDDFDFGTYMRHALDKNIINLIEVDSRSWIVISVVIVLNMVRVVIMRAAGTACDNKQDYESKACLDETLMAYVCGGFLLVFCTVALNLAARLYELRLIAKAGLLATSEYEDYLTTMCTHEVLLELKQRNSVEDSPAGLQPGSGISGGARPVRSLQSQSSGDSVKGGIGRGRPLGSLMRRQQSVQLSLDELREKTEQLRAKQLEEESIEREKQKSRSSSMHEAATKVQVGLKFVWRGLRSSVGATDGSQVYAAADRSPGSATADVTGSPGAGQPPSTRRTSSGDMGAEHGVHGKLLSQGTMHAGAIQAMTSGSSSSNGGVATSANFVGATRQARAALRASGGAVAPVDAGGGAGGVGVQAGGPGARGRSSPGAAKHADKGRRAQQATRSMLRHVRTLRSFKATEDLSDIFLFRSPQLFFQAIECLMLINTLYLSLWATSFVVIADQTSTPGLWHFIMLLPVVFMIPMLGEVVRTSSLIVACSKLDPDIVGHVVEETQEMRRAEKELRAKIRRRLVAFMVDNQDLHDPRKVIHELFAEVDTDRSGVVSKDELRSMLRILGLHFSALRFKRLFRGLDFNKDGTISEDEMFRLVFPKEVADEEFKERKKLARKRINKVAAYEMKLKERVSNTSGTSTHGFGQRAVRKIVGRGISGTDAEALLSNSSSEDSEDELFDHASGTASSEAGEDERGVGDVGSSSATASASDAGSGKDGKTDGVNGDVDVTSEPTVGSEDGADDHSDLGSANARAGVSAMDSIRESTHSPSLVGDPDADRQIRQPEDDVVDHVDHVINDDGTQVVDGESALEMTTDTLPDVDLPRSSGGSSGRQADRRADRRPASRSHRNRSRTGSGADGEEDFFYAPEEGTGCASPLAKQGGHDTGARHCRETSDEDDGVIESSRELWSEVGDAEDAMESQSLALAPDDTGDADEDSLSASDDGPQGAVAMMMTTAMDDNDSVTRMAADVRLHDEAGDAARETEMDVLLRNAQLQAGDDGACEPTTDIEDDADDVVDDGDM